MKTIRMSVLVVLLAVAVATQGSEPKASDFDTNFVVDAFEYQVSGDTCLMKLESQNTIYFVTDRYNDQQIWPVCYQHHSGENCRGRIKGGLKGYRIELLGVDKKGKPKVEIWYVTNQVQ